MQKIHLPVLGPRYWVALCIASIFGANMGDFFAHNLGLGHVAGLPFLAVALAIVVIVERFDRSWHESYYWTAIIIVRTAATNSADFACGDLKLPRVLVMVALVVVLAAAVWTSWKLSWRTAAADKSRETGTVLRADLGYWICMFIAGTLGTVIGDYCSHNLHFDDGESSLLLSPVVAALFLVGRNGPLRLLPFYWLTVVAIRAAGTSVGDFISGRNMLGLPLSTFVTGMLFVVVLAAWRQPAKPNQAEAVPVN
jgi:uncharacterized membrane-anchored protein